jgi:hypothetical protein
MPAKNITRKASRMGRKRMLEFNRRPENNPTTANGISERQKFTMHDPTGTNEKR